MLRPSRLCINWDTVEKLPEDRYQSSTTRLCTHKASVDKFWTYRMTRVHRDTQTHRKWPIVAHRKFQRQPERANNERGGTVIVTIRRGDVCPFWKSRT